MMGVGMGCDWGEIYVIVCGWGRGERDGLGLCDGVMGVGSRGVDLVVDADETQLVHHMPLSCFSRCECGLTSEPCPWLRPETPSSYAPATRALLCHPGRCLLDRRFVFVFFCLCLCVSVCGCLRVCASGCAPCGGCTLTLLSSPLCPLGSTCPVCWVLIGCVFSLVLLSPPPPLPSALSVTQVTPVAPSDPSGGCSTEPGPRCTFTCTTHPRCRRGDSVL